VSLYYRSSVKQMYRRTTYNFADLDFVAAALERLFADLRPVRPVRLLGSGFSSIVVETADEIVFKIAKTIEAAHSQAREARLLPFLHPLLPFPIPNPQRYIAASEDFPFGVIGYQKLPGVPLDPTRHVLTKETPLAQDIATFLYALSTVPAVTLQELQLLGPLEHAQQLSMLEPEVLPALQRELTSDEYQRIEQWWTAFAVDPQLHGYPVRLCHGDLWHENLLVSHDSQVLTGVVDFERAAFGDPAQDFATLLYLGEPFVARVLAAYAGLGGYLDPGIHYRIERLWESRDFGGVQYSIQYADAAELRDSLHKLRQGPILNPTHRRHDR
jgi:aminoglycoside phosphotransferase (APT) family kinase protein